MAAYRLPKSTDDEKAARKAAIAGAMRGATEAPLETLKLAGAALEQGEVVARLGNPSAASDAGVGVGLLAAAAEGAAANVRVNLDGLADTAFRDEAAAAMEQLLAQAAAHRARVGPALG
jgi:glutamate formiminotransferase/formiminotetrahydrofolate cyclodeaminase